MADLYIGEDEATDIERAAVQAALGAYEPAVIVESERLVRGGTERRRERRTLLLPALHALQRAAGWISPGGLNHVAERLQVPPAEAYGVATFYELFRTDRPLAGSTTHVCIDLACRIAGSEQRVAELEAAGEPVHRSPCLGQCDRAPSSFVQGVGADDSVAADDEPFALPQAGDPALRLLRRVGVVDPTSLDSYRERDGFAALDRARELGADAVIQMVTDSGLSGRGGAAFPTGVKWRAVADAAGESKHVVANCDESEPGTFKDRVLMEHDPFAIVEAMAIAALATGADQGWIYIRGEYPRATERLRAAVDQSRRAGHLGDGFDIEIRRGAGAYICGEETALFNSIEGFRGEPRNKPPFPVTNGLFDQPTAINSPETLVNVPTILLDGVDAYRSVGSEGSPGTRLFCLSGHVNRPGIYELPFGVTLGEVLDAAGGVDGELATILLGGAAGRFASPDRLDLPLTLEHTRAAGLGLGSGVVMAFNTEVDVTDIVARITEFFRDESCGQCVPCRIGTVRTNETIVALQRTGTLTADRRALIDDMALAMGDASICGLGHTAASAVQSALDLGLIGAIR